MSDLLSQPLVSSILQWLAGLSVITFLLSVILIPIIIGRLRQNFFIILDRKITIRRKHDLKFFILLISRNFFGWLLLAAGILMLFLPGQGLITIVLGLMFVTFPGKHRLFRRLIRMKKLQKALDWLRQKRKQTPFSWPKPGQRSTNY